ncbi:MFS transporter [Tomitella biformata]|uniref:MFS transporter n=1 Tax=Tomitella biformata TaxID=630403 RepID=UPI000465C35F|nr:MFS transporter [Tomitella biformata]
MTRAAAIRSQTFASLVNPNFRRYISGQGVSVVGTWMQIIAQGWLVLQLTGSGTAIGIVVALQTLPMLLLGPYGGVIADRVDKRRLMIALQSVMGVQALALGVLTLTGSVQLWHVYVLAVLLGLNQCFENPARQAFLMEVVGPGHVRNAVSLQSVLNSMARAVGPAVAGIIISYGGLGLCFLLNAASFVAVVLSLVTLNLAALMPTEPAVRARGQLRAGLAYVRRTPELAIPLAMMALMGCFTYEFQVVLPVVADKVFGAGASGYGFMTAAMGVGAVVGGLWIATWGRTGARSLVVIALAFGAAIALTALAQSLWVAVAALVVVGMLSVGFTATANSTLQLAAAPDMRGRVMALWAVAFLGSTAIGGPVAGWVSEEFGGRAGLALAAVTCIVAAGLGVAGMMRGRTAVLAVS